MSGKKVEQRHLTTSLSLVSFDWATGKLFAWLVLGGSQVEVIGGCGKELLSYLLPPFPRGFGEGQLRDQ